MTPYTTLRTQKVTTTLYDKAAKSSFRRSQLHDIYMHFQESRKYDATEHHFSGHLGSWVPSIDASKAKRTARDDEILGSNPQLDTPRDLLTIVLGQAEPRYLVLDRYIANNKVTIAIRNLEGSAILDRTSA